MQTKSSKNRYYQQQQQQQQQNTFTLFLFVISKYLAYILYVYRPTNTCTLILHIYNIIFLHLACKIWAFFSSQQIVATPPEDTDPQDVHDLPLGATGASDQNTPRESGSVPFTGVFSYDNRAAEYSEISADYMPLSPLTRSWEVPREKVKIEKVIGSGAFGQVAKATATEIYRAPGQTTVAVKMLKGAP